MTTTAHPKHFGLLALNMALQNSSKMLKETLINLLVLIIHLLTLQSLSSSAVTVRQKGIF